jgi:DNA-directed RNA polymerase specialized sigma24 family protein
MLDVKKTTRAFDDTEVLTAIRSSGREAEQVIAWFISGARVYARRYLARKYPEFDKHTWDSLFANVDIKFVSRLRKGIELQEGTKLTTYYTSIAKFAALDQLGERKVAAYTQQVEDHQAIAPPDIERKIDLEERQGLIREWLHKVVGNEQQVLVMLLQAEGLSYREILDQTEYQSEGACRNAVVKGKKKIMQYLLRFPEAAGTLKSLLAKS